MFFALDVDFIINFFAQLLWRSRRFLKGSLSTVAVRRFITSATALDFVIDVVFFKNVLLIA